MKRKRNDAKRDTVNEMKKIKSYTRYQEGKVEIIKM